MLGFRSVFSRLFVSVFLALMVFAIAMLLWAQLVQNNSDTLKNRAIARQIAQQVDPFLKEVDEYISNNNRLQARFTMVIIKKSFDIFDQTLNAKIGLYSRDKQLILQTEDSELPPTLIHESSWLGDMLPTLSGEIPHHVQVKTSSGYTIWYESRKPPQRNRFLAIFNLFTGTILLFGIMTLVLWWIAHSITKRIDDLGQQMKRLGDGDFSVRVTEVGNDEITLLAHGFNQSAQKIEQLINANNLLLAHASHEFRTPITRIRLQIEMMDMLASQLDADSKAKFDKRASAINRDLTGLNDLVESILLVSRLDAGHALQKQETVDFYELVASECQHYPEASLYGESIVIQSQPKLLTHLIRNLLNNALIHGVAPITVCVYGVYQQQDVATLPEHLINTINHSPIASTDGIAIEETENADSKPHDKQDKKSIFFGRFNRKDDKPNLPNFAVLAVIDEGTGIPVEKRTDIFSPFVRLKQEKKGSGLGLSLVAQIVETHGGHISTDTWQGKTRFLVVLPIKKTPKDSDAKEE